MKFSTLLPRVKGKGNGNHGGELEDTGRRLSFQWTRWRFCLWLEVRKHSNKTSFLYVFFFPWQWYLVHVSQKHLWVRSKDFSQGRIKLIRILENVEIFQVLLSEWHSLQFISNFSREKSIFLYKGEASILTKWTILTNQEHIVLSPKMRGGEPEKGELVSVEDKCYSFVFVNLRTNFLISILIGGVGQAYIAMEKVFEALNYAVIWCSFYL